MSKDEAWKNNKIAVGHFSFSFQWWLLNMFKFYMAWNLECCTLPDCELETIGQLQRHLHSCKWIKVQWWVAGHSPIISNHVWSSLIDSNWSRKGTKWINMDRAGSKFVDTFTRTWDVVYWVYCFFYCLIILICLFLQSFGSVAMPRGRQAARFWWRDLAGRSQIRLEPQFTDVDRMLTECWQMLTVHGSGASCGFRWISNCSEKLYLENLRNIS